MIKITIDSDRANIKVSDNGRGIPDKIRQKIFKMFFSTDISSEGAGLGLYIVNETIKKLRGSIEYSSEIGIGTKFTVIIPNLGNSNTS
ncbi:MAG: Signal transduction histidine kinase [Chlorobi bacterium OLB4]|nr:MAG: Signal transduction histidine kinase [Chlorobi bacterium OLB4]